MGWMDPYGGPSNPCILGVRVWYIASSKSILFLVRAGPYQGCHLFGGGGWGHTWACGFCLGVFFFF